MTLMTVWVTVIAAALLTAVPGGGSGGVTGARAAGAAAARGVSDAGGPGGPGPGCAGPPGAAARCWPVTGPGARGRPAVLRGFDPPAAPWAAGHRGVDLRASPGAAVRAAAPGEITFAGRVGGIPVVVVGLQGGLRTTYEPVRAAVPVGAQVAAGRPVGVVDGVLGHCPDGCLHWGLLRGDVYLDPLTLLPPSLRRSGPSRLLPVYGAARR